MEQLLVPIVFGCIAYALTRWAYKQELKEAENYTHGLKMYRDLLIEEGESQKAGCSDGD